MKFTLFATVALLSVTAQATAIKRDDAPSDLYVPSRDITCSMGADGSTSCVKGHINNAPSIADMNVSNLPDSTLLEREMTELDKRLSCVRDELCWAHCFAIGYCNAYCEKGICHCKCMDKTPWYDVVPCIKTTCN